MLVNQDFFDIFWKDAKKMSAKLLYLTSLYIKVYKFKTARSARN